MQEFRDHRRHAAKVPGARGAVEPIAQPRNFDKGFRAGRIHLLDRRSEDQFDCRPLRGCRNPPSRSGDRRVQVFVGTELGGVDEDGDGTKSQEPSPRRRERNAQVQRAHGGDRPSVLPAERSSRREAFAFRDGRQERTSPDLAGVACPGARLRLRARPSSP